jgi:hypothetical protein
LRLVLFKTRLLTKRALRSLGRNEVPEDFRSLNLDEVSSLENFVEKFDKGDELGISELIKFEFNHL